MIMSLIRLSRFLCPTIFLTSFGLVLVQSPHPAPPQSVSAWAWAFVAIAAVVLILFNPRIIGAIYMLALISLLVIIADSLDLVGVVMARKSAPGQLDIEGTKWRRSRHSIVKQGWA